MRNILFTLLWIFIWSKWTLQSLLSFVIWIFNNGAALSTSNFHWVGSTAGFVDTIGL